MAKVAVTLILVAAMVAATSMPAKSAPAPTAIEVVSAIKKGLEDVIATAPDSKKCEIKDATFKHAVYLASSLAEAAGHAKKVTEFAVAYRTVADKIVAAAPPAKFAVMEEAFKAAAGHVA